MARKDYLFYFLLYMTIANISRAVAQTTGSPPPVNESAEMTMTTRLRIAVPVKGGFSEFVRVSVDPTTGEQNFSGFSIDVFKAVANGIQPNPLDFEFVPFAKPDGTMNGTYDDMLKAVFFKDYDGAVGDITIRYYRRQWVDFTEPYSETGVSMLVPLHQKSSTKNAKGVPLMSMIKGLIISALAIFVVTALVFCILDYRKKNGLHQGAIVRNEDDRQSKFSSESSIKLSLEQVMQEVVTNGSK